MPKSVPSNLAAFSNDGLISPHNENDPELPAFSSVIRKLDPRIVYERLV